MKMSSVKLGFSADAVLRNVHTQPYATDAVLLHLITCNIPVQSCLSVANECFQLKTFCMGLAAVFGSHCLSCSGF